MINAERSQHLPKRVIPKACDLQTDVYTTMMHKKIPSGSKGVAMVAINIGGRQHAVNAGTGTA